MTALGWLDFSRAGESIPRADTGIWHADDCAGGSSCDGCGWIDADLTWWPGPCPTLDLPFQQRRAEG